MNNKTKELGLVLTGADEAEKTFQQFRLELSGNTGNSNMEIIDKAFGELVTLIGNKKVYIRAVDGYIQYSEDDQTWHNVIALSELKGAKGDSALPEHTEVDEGKFLRIVGGSPTWQAVVNGEEVKF